MSKEGFFISIESLILIYVDVDEINIIWIRCFIYDLLVQKSQHSNTNFSCSNLIRMESMSNTDNWDYMTTMFRRLDVCCKHIYLVIGKGTPKDTISRHQKLLLHLSLNWKRKRAFLVKKCKKNCDGHEKEEKRLYSTRQIQPLLKYKNSLDNTMISHLFPYKRKGCKM